MSRILLIHSSPMYGSEKGSISSTAAKFFIEEYKEHNPVVDLITLDLNKEDVGNKNINAINNASGDFFKDGISDKYITLLKNVDKVVVALSMTNFTYPAVLKNFLDHVLVAGKTFQYKYDGKGVSEGLVKNLKVQLIMAQGATLGWYPFSGYDKALIGTFEFMGAQVCEPIIIDGTKTQENRGKTTLEQVNPHLTKIKNAARSF